MKTIKNPKEDFKNLIEHEVNIREELAVNLHQDIFPKLLALKVNLSVKSKRIADISQKDLELEKELKEITEVMENLRVFYYKLYPSLLKHLGLFKTIHSNIREIAKKYSTAIDVMYDYYREEPHFEMDWKLQVYFATESIIEYLITKNKTASFVVELKRKENEICIKITGKVADAIILKSEDFPALDEKYLNGIEARLGYLNASVSRETNWSTLVAITIPLND